MQRFLEGVPHTNISVSCKVAFESFDFFLQGCKLLGLSKKTI